MNKLVSIILIAAISGLVAGGIAAFSFTKFYQPSQEDLITSFYATETAVLVSPHGLRKKMAAAKEDFILVDVRSHEEYLEEHIVGAVNIPAYSDRDTSDYGAVDRITNSFRELDTDKDIIVYCYSVPCMTGRKVGHMLAQNGIYVKELGVGWNEWRYHWELWNHPHEWNITNPDDYVVSGEEPGALNPDLVTTGCSTNGELGC